MGKCYPSTYENPNSWVLPSGRERKAKSRHSGDLQCVICVMTVVSAKTKDSDKFLFTFTAAKQVVGSVQLTMFQGSVLYLRTCQGNILSS